MRETTRRPKCLGRLGRVVYTCERESRNIDTRDRVRKTAKSKRPQTRNATKLLTGAYCRSLPRCGIANGPRIVGGQQVNPKNKYPWIVGLNILPVTNRTLYDCVGSIINDLYILSAAHCLFDQDTLVQLDASSVMVGIGDHNQLSTDDDVEGITRQIEVEEIKIFSQFSIVNVDFDIALLKLKEPLDFTPKEIGPICLPKDDTQTYGGDQGVVVGWGITKEGEINQPAILMEVELPILPAAVCETMMVNFFDITERMICASVEGGKDACEGDSGGPLSVVEGEQHIVVGVSAFGEGCARDKPGVYSRVMENQWNMQFILDQLVTMQQRQGTFYSSQQTVLTQQDMV
ncbi:trypsin-1-like [Portunus trituberculatus]|uniref:trypsin-1-like n=1 Tax=Portunus trituberculatus TaxID=210409 RepID=UPI001E1D09DD|nr:trypsin-1-like [Portunus trituberculatus]